MRWRRRHTHTRVPPTGTRKLEISGQSGKLVDAATRIGDLVGDKAVEALLDRAAAVAVPDLDQVGDLFERKFSFLARAMKPSRANERSS